VKEEEGGASGEGESKSVWMQRQKGLPRKPCVTLDIGRTSSPMETKVTAADAK
jgi:hypothetical protein